jgi:hypothetical protein
MFTISDYDPGNRGVGNRTDAMSSQAVYRNSKRRNFYNHTKSSASVRKTRSQAWNERTQAPRGSKAKLLFARQRRSIKRIKTLTRKGIDASLSHRGSWICINSMRGQFTSRKNRRTENLHPPQTIPYKRIPVLAAKYTKNPQPRKINMFFWRPQTAHARSKMRTKESFVTEGSILIAVTYNESRNLTIRWWCM